MLGNSGVDLRTAQELAGHSSPILTARYIHRRLYALAGAVGKLPSFVAAKPAAAPPPAAATGTDGQKQLTVQLTGASVAAGPGRLTQASSAATEHRGKESRKHVRLHDS